MISYLPRYIFNFIFFILLQVVVLNNIQFSGFVNPYLYVLFIITLPFEIPNWLLLVFGFVTGLIIDVFSNTLGMHASATLFMCYLRPFLLRAFSPRDEYQPGTIPNIHCFGTAWFLRYALILVFAHHFFLFFIEVFSFKHIFSTLWRIVASTTFTMALIYIAQVFALGKPKGK